MLVSTHESTWRRNPEERLRHMHRREDLEFLLCVDQQEIGRELTSSVYDPPYGIAVVDIARPAIKRDHGLWVDRPVLTVGADEISFLAREATARDPIVFGGKL